MPTIPLGPRLLAFQAKLAAKLEAHPIKRGRYRRTWPSQIEKKRRKELERFIDAYPELAERAPSVEGAILP